MQKLINSIRLIILFFIGFITVLFSQEDTSAVREGLVISEIYLNRNQPKKSWFEIYNPSNDTLVLESFRLAIELTINMLPSSVKNQGGVALAPDDYLVICADSSKIRSFGTIKKMIVVEELAYFYVGYLDSIHGFIALRTKGFDHIKDKGIDIVHYGNAEIPSNFSKKYRQGIVRFSDKKSYSRKFTKTKKGVKILGLYQSNLTPGLKNEEKE